MSGLQPKILSFDVFVTTIAAVLKSSDALFRAEVIILADENNTDTILIGGIDTQTFPLVAGASVTIKKTSLNLIYAISASGPQTLHIITGGN